MLKKGCLIAPCEPTPTPTPTPGRSRTTGFFRHLPQDLVNDQLGRLALFSLIGVALWTTGLLIDQLVMLTMPSVYRYTGWKPRALEVLGIIALGVDVLLRALRST